MVLKKKKNGLNSTNPISKVHGGWKCVFCLQHYYHKCRTEVWFGFDIWIRKQQTVRNTENVPKCIRLWLLPV